MFNSAPVSFHGDLYPYTKCMSNCLCIARILWLTLGKDSGRATAGVSYVSVKHVFKQM